MSETVTITLLPSGQTLEATKGSNLLRCLQKNQIPVGSSCGGQGLCASCKITVVHGMKFLSTPEDKEVDLADRNHLNSHERISCQCIVQGSISITTTYW